MINQDEAKAMYEFSKLTCVTKQLMDDFFETVVMYLFNEHVSKLKNKEVFVNNFLDHWEASVVDQKQNELKIMSESSESLQDMVTTSYIVNSEDLSKYKESAAIVKLLLQSSVLGK